MATAESWLKVTPKGLYCIPGDFYIDPHARVERAVITHGHGDHARPGHERVLATPETLTINRLRMGNRAGRTSQALAYGEIIDLGGIKLRLAPAGHILGSAQVVMEHRGTRVVVSGDYKRRFDPTCPPFEVVPCDVFITEATFGLPVFRHPADDDEVAKLLASVARNPDRTHLIGAYALGKAQRLMALLRQAGYARPIYMHDHLAAITRLYQDHGIHLGELRLVTGGDIPSLAGEIVLAPPGAIGDRWARDLTDPLTGFASGWMRIRKHARQRGGELPLILSDHADWDELTATITDVGAAEVWVTHGREDALVRYAQGRTIRARALSTIGHTAESR